MLVVSCVDYALCSYPHGSSLSVHPLPTPLPPSLTVVDYQHMNHTPRSVKPYYRDCIIRAPPLPPIDSRATRAEVECMC